jgi:acyl-coenzyme A thioesterase PaaI-like protein
LSDNPLPQHVIDAFWRRWGNNDFMRAQGLEVDIFGVGEAVVRLPRVMATQRGGGGSDTVLNGGVIAYMFDGALGCAIASSLLARPEMRGIDPQRLRQSTINLDISYVDAARRPLPGPRQGRARQPQHRLRRRRAARCPGPHLRHGQGHLAHLLAARRRTGPTLRTNRTYGDEPHEQRHPSHRLRLRLLGRHRIRRRPTGQRGDIDVLVFDYLAEITMSLLSRAKAKDPALGYAPDFVAPMKPLMKEIKTRGIQVIANAGGVNPSACRAALVAAAQAEGVDLKIAAVLGDDLMPQVEALRAAGTPRCSPAPPSRQGDERQRLPRRLPDRRRAGDAGADIVVTGRCVDSAVTLAPLIHALAGKPTTWTCWRKAAWPAT